MIIRISALIGLIFFCSLASAARCAAEALAMLRANGGSSTILNSKFALEKLHGHINCGDVRDSLDTTYHEMIHGYTGGTGQLPLVRGGSVRTIENDTSVMSYFKPATIAKEFGNRYNVAEYLRAGTEDVELPGDNFGAQLDELNAYTHQLALDLKLRSGSTSGTSGTVALASFVAAYLRKAKEVPSVWNDLNSPDKKSVVKAIWDQMETVLNAACSSRPAMPFTEDRGQFYRKYLCNPEKMSGVAALTGRSDICPTRACIGMKDKPIPPPRGGPIPITEYRRPPVRPKAPPPEVQGGDSFVLPDFGTGVR